MQKTIKLEKGGVAVEYVLRLSKRSKRVRLAVHSDGRCVVSAPVRASQRMIEQLVWSKAEWIRDKVAYFATRPSIDTAFKAGGTAAEYKKHRAVALALVQERLVYFNHFYGYSWGSIVIRNQKTRWGSCSKKGNLNFNYKIALLPPTMSDYIVVHELCHLGEFNHSANFWNLVARTIPDYKAIRDALKKNNLELY